MQKPVILLLGEGNFSFTEAFVDKYPEPDACATLFRASKGFAGVWR